MLFIALRGLLGFAGQFIKIWEDDRVVLTQASLR
ncbi:hypothetical protein SAMN04515668_3568 [Hymenobacter arizonensis]|uniref:Uncharacterized protein n=1 Tax=Hymenobacter arizonensis TaxID=1227077 RepID=A0A1I6AD89_HYMAR|nr:hypothetical protein SAMN04515668_3568 [Hymenobacter arizonensis]